MPFKDEQLTAIRGGLIAEEYRWKLIREVCDKTPGQQATDEVSHETEVRNDSDCRRCHLLRCNLRIGWIAKTHPSAAKPIRSAGRLLRPTKGRLPRAVETRLARQTPRLSSNSLLAPARLIASGD